MYQAAESKSVVTTEIKQIIFVSYCCSGLNHWHFVRAMWGLYFLREATHDKYSLGSVCDHTLL